MEESGIRREAEVVGHCRVAVLSEFEHVAAGTAPVDSIDRNRL